MKKILPPLIVIFLITLAGFYLWKNQELSSMQTEFELNTPNESGLGLTTQEKIPQADLDIATIQQYYKKIAEGELSEAYAMKIKPEVSFETFNQWYKDTDSATTYGFRSTSEEEYYFYVDLFEAGKRDSKYQLHMKVEGGKIQTLSSSLVEKK